MRAINIALLRSAGYHVIRFSLLIGLLAYISFNAAIPSASQTLTPNGQKPEVLAPGIEHIQIIRGYKSEKEATGPWFINMVRMDLSRASLRLVHGMDEAVGLETVSSMAARYGALAAVNSGYFRTTGTYRGDSVGAAVTTGKILSESNNVRAAIGLIEEGTTQKLIFGHLQFEGHLASGKGTTWKGELVGAPTHAINGLNRPRADNELIVFTPEFHRTTLTEPTGLEIVVRRGRVVSAGDLKGSSAIPADGFVVSTSGTAREWALEHLRLGTKVQLRLNLSPVEVEQAEAWKRAASVIGGGPQLIKNGRVEITNTAEKILPSFVSDGHPRTAIARLKSGNRSSRVRSEEHRLNSSHTVISYAVFCLKKKKRHMTADRQIRYSRT